jgi:folate-binding protein YgfZ
MFVLRAKVTIEALHEMQVAGLYEHEIATARTAVFTPLGVSLRYGLTAPGVEHGTALQHWRREEIRRGISWLQSETSERFLPQMLGLERIGAVSFSKGCYPGQEIIARTRYLGKLKRRPVLLELDGSPTLKPGESCVLLSASERVEGVVVEAAGDEGTGTTLLVVAPVEADRPLSALAIGGESWSARRIDQA